MSEKVLKSLKYNFTKYNIIYILFFLVFSLIVGILYIYDIKMEDIFIVQSADIKNKVYMIYMIGFCIFAIVIGLLIFFFNKYKDIKLHKKFFIVGLVLGSIFIFAIPFLSGSDEMAHFCRIYEGAIGNYITPVDVNGNQGSVMPKSLDLIYKTNENLNNFRYININEGTKIKLDKEDTMLYENYYPSSAIYSLAQYIPQIIGVKIAIMLNFNIYFVGILGRIFGFIFWLFVCTYAIKKIPKHKMLLSIILLNPISITFATSLSGDTVLNACIAVFVATIYEICYSKRKINIKDKIILFVTSIMIALCKIVYLPLILALFVLPSNSYKSKKDKYITTILIGMISGIVSLIWLGITNKLFVAVADTNGLNKDFILNNPLEYFVIMIRSFLYFFVQYITELTAGTAMCNGQVSIYSAISIILFGFVVISALNEGNELKLDKIKKVILIFAIISTIILMQTALYLQFTSEKSQYIHGIQGRYFIPIIMTLSLLIQDKKVKFKENNIFNAFLIIQLPVILTVFSKFII